MHANGVELEMFMVPQDPRVTKFRAMLRRWLLGAAAALQCAEGGDEPSRADPTP